MVIMCPSMYMYVDYTLGYTLINYSCTMVCYSSDDGALLILQTGNYTGAQFKREKQSGEIFVEHH